MYHVYQTIGINDAVRLSIKNALIITFQKSVYNVHIPWWCSREHEGLQTILLKKLASHYPAELMKPKSAFSTIQK